MKAATIADVFRNALGSKPSEWKRGGALGIPEIEALRTTYVQWATGNDELHHPGNELWPLISHHDDLDDQVILRNFVVRPEAHPHTSAKNPMRELKAHLTACNGVILADPLRRIFFDVDGREIRRPTSDDVLRVADRIGQLESLLDEGLVRISKVHPDLSSTERQEFIAPFNLGPNLSTLTDFIAEGIWPPPSRTEQEFYPRKVQQLLELCGLGENLDASLFPPNTTPVDKLMRFARTLMEVSWQLAHVTATGADLYLTTPLEMRVFEILLEDCADKLADEGLIEVGPYAEGRHLRMMATVGLPAIDVDSIEFNHLIDIRHGDAFTRWRVTLNDYKRKPLEGHKCKTAIAEFRTRMELASIQLRDDAKKRSFRSAVKEAAVTMPFTVASAGISGLVSTGSITAAALAGAGAGAANGGLIRYFYNRRRKKDEAAIRFVAAVQSR
jgi:hypothetical protein